MVRRVWGTWAGLSPYLGRRVLADLDWIHLFLCRQCTSGPFFFPILQRTVLDEFLRICWVPAIQTKSLWETKGMHKKSITCREDKVLRPPWHSIINGHLWLSYLFSIGWSHYRVLSQFSIPNVSILIQVTSLAIWERAKDTILSLIGGQPDEWGVAGI